MSRKKASTQNRNSVPKFQYDLKGFCCGCGKPFDGYRQPTQRVTLQWRDGFAIYSAPGQLCGKCAWDLWGIGFMNARPRRVKNGR